MQYGNIEQNLKHQLLGHALALSLQKAVFNHAVIEAAVCTLVEECQQEAVRVIDACFSNKKAEVPSLCRKMVAQEINPDQALAQLWNENHFAVLKEFLQKKLSEKFSVPSLMSRTGFNVLEADVLMDLKLLVTGLEQEAVFDHLGRWCFDQLLSSHLPPALHRIFKRKGDALWQHVSAPCRREDLLPVLQRQLEGWLENIRLRLIARFRREVAEHIFCVFDHSVPAAAG
ncbi:hypothetical protein [Desulfotomaculum copahuensis]|uniref:Uncharacterized protein n=1 Tax=Desulfotomaculum copahuensis TaxID=1838280 RepID=A0A1B7LER7_9FIRM|nr:hypothetical protein [Desulfotomaculum copahuensis]OAT81773.1 hypothetical protein A6M21_10260 [Desulfotomaculum copahuensis]